MKSSTNNQTSRYLGIILIVFSELSLRQARFSNTRSGLLLLSNFRRSIPFLTFLLIATNSMVLVGFYLPNYACGVVRAHFYFGGVLFFLVAILIPSAFRIIIHEMQKVVSVGPEELDTGASLSSVKKILWRFRLIRRELCNQAIINGLLWFLLGSIPQFLHYFCWVSGTF